VFTLGSELSCTFIIAAATDAVSVAAAAATVGDVRLVYCMPYLCIVIAVSFLHISFSELSSVADVLVGTPTYGVSISVCSARSLGSGSTWRLIGCRLCKC